MLRDKTEMRIDGYFVGRNNALLRFGLPQRSFVLTLTTRTR
jgi:hypothetical protein